MNLLELIQRFTARTNIPRPQVVAESVDKKIIQMM